jgi:hypothetical protein
MHFRLPRPTIEALRPVWAVLLPLDSNTAVRSGARPDGSTRRQVDSTAVRHRRAASTAARRDNSMNRRTRPETRTATLRPASNTMRPGDSTAFHAPALRPDGNTVASET